MIHQGLLRKGEELYYSGKEEGAKKLFPRLPQYGDGDLSEDAGYYFDDLEKYVKQYN